MTQHCMQMTLNRQAVTLSTLDDGLSSDLPSKSRWHTAWKWHIMPASSLFTRTLNFCWLSAWHLCAISAPYAPAIEPYVPPLQTLQETLRGTAKPDTFWTLNKQEVQSTRCLLVNTKYLVRRPQAAETQARTDSGQEVS